MTKKINLFLLGIGTICTLTIPALALNAASYLEKSETSERGGQPVIVETYTLPIGENPDQLIKEPFDTDGVHYVHDITQTQEMQSHEEKFQEITVTAETKGNDMQEILAALPVKEAYSKEGFTGELLLDTTSLKTERSGSKEVSYTVTGTKTVSGLERNDPALVPQTMSKSGLTLKLKNVNWSVDGYSIDENNLDGGTYTATASYSGTGYKTVATGYTTTAKYSGTVTRTQPDHLTCIITYVGTPIPTPDPEPEPEPDLDPTFEQDAPSVWLYASCLWVAAALLLLIMLLRWWYTSTVRIYSAARGEDDFKLVRRRHLSRKYPKIRLYEPSNADYAVVVKRKMCRKLIGRTITVSMEKCTVKQTVRSGERDLWIMLEPWKEGEDED